MKKEHRALKITTNIIIYSILAIFVSFSIFALISKFTMKSEGGAMNFFGHETRIVLTGSMEGSDEFYNEHPEYEIKKINTKDAVFIDTVPNDEEKAQAFYHDIKVGDVLTFIYQAAGNVVVTHRVIAIEENAHHIVFTLRGDNPSGDKIVYPTDDRIQTVASDTGLIIGKVTGVNTFLGNLLYTLSSNKIVLVLLVIVPCGTIALYEIGKVVYYIYKNKHEQELVILKEEDKNKDEELARLKEELERMKKERDNQNEDK